MLTETDYMVVSGTTDTASVTSDSYNSAGQLLYSVNGVGDTTAYSYDADGNTVQEVDGYGTTDSATTQYQYDRAGGQTAIIDPAGDTTNFALNADGQTVGMTEDLGTSTSSEAYTYNLAGQLVQTIDENGGTEAYVNDADGRVTGETWYNSGGTAVESFSYSYDEAGNMLTAMNTQGMDTFSYSFTYNAAGEVLTVSEPFGVSLSFGYNLAGERTTVSDSFGGSESLTYDAEGDLTSLTYNVSGSTVSMNFTYNQAGQQTQESMYYNFGLIATVSESHDADGDVLTIVDTNTSAATIDSFSYAYDLANEVTTESDYSGASTSYTYNAAGELINAGTQTYNYDAAGDADSTGDNDSGGNEQTSFVDPATGDTLDYTYDNAGNELTKTDTNTGLTWAYGYNNANQVVTATETNSLSVTQEVVNYEYDAFGNMLKETTTPYVSGVAGSSTVTEFAVDGWNPAKSQAMGDLGFDTWAVMNGSGSLQTRNIIGNQIDQILARIDNATNGASDPSGVYFTLTDKDGSVRDVLNSTANAAPVDVITYDAWGNILSQTSTNGSVTTPSDYLGHYSWDGYDYDTADSLYLDHARIYDAASQRWMSQDPMGYAAGDSNLYRYVNNAPTNHDDPSGLQDDGPILRLEKRPRDTKSDCLEGCHGGNKPFPPGANLFGGGGNRNAPPKIAPPTQEDDNQNIGIGQWLMKQLRNVYEKGQVSVNPLQWELKHDVVIWGKDFKIGWSVTLSYQWNVATNDASVNVSGSIYGENSNFPLNAIWPVLPPWLKGVVKIAGGISVKALKVDAKGNIEGGIVSFNGVSLTLGVRVSSKIGENLKVYGELGVTAGPLSVEIWPPTGKATLQAYAYLRVGAEFGWGDPKDGWKWKRAYDVRLGTSLNLD